MDHPQLLDHRGRPILNFGDRDAGPAASFTKADPPKLGPFGDWAGRDVQYLTLPGGGVMQFDLSRLQLSDFRTMRTHYQLNASLMILTFMMHNLDWRIECTNTKIADQLEANLRQVWTRLIRAVSQAYWAGFSPCILDFDNNTTSGYIELTEVKDMIPEESRVEWETVQGWAPPTHQPPKIRQYNGFRTAGQSWPIPSQNTLWYPLLMENGDYYGRKLLKPSFPSWFFSQLLHLFSNRYYERFGEPLPVGRAPFDQQVDVGGGQMASGRDAMAMILTNLRNRSVVTLPSSRSGGTGNAAGEYEWDIEYLESQMRGADFERYMARLDEEMSLSLFTPVLLFRTADVGSYNLGQSHLQLYQWCLDALAGDLAQVIQDYVLKPVLHDSNFGPNAPPAFFRWRSMAKNDTQILSTIIEWMLRSNTVQPDLDEIGQIIGLKFNEIQALSPTGTPTTEITPPPVDPNADPKGVSVNRRSSSTGQLLADRLAGQIEKAWREETFGTDRFRPKLGYRRQFEEALRGDGLEPRQAEAVYGRLQTLLDQTLPLGREEFAGPEEFIGYFRRAVEIECAELKS